MFRREDRLDNGATRIEQKQWIPIMVEIFHTILLCKSTSKALSNGYRSHSSLVGGFIYPCLSSVIPP